MEKTKSIPERIAEWESAGGAQLFHDMGVANGSRVFDFGFGHGHYAVAAVNAAGPAGTIYAADCDPDSAERLKKRISAEGIGNITVMQTRGGIAIELPDSSIDFIMLYDMLHFEQLDKAGLIAESHRVLKPGGTLSILPFHLPDDAVTRLCADIIQSGFGSPTALPGTGLHIGMLYSAYHENESADFDSMEKGTIYNFKRD